MRFPKWTIFVYFPNKFFQFLVFGILILFIFQKFDSFFPALNFIQ